MPGQAAAQEIAGETCGLGAWTDLLVVDGDPSESIRTLQNQARFYIILMKSEEIWKSTITGDVAERDNIWLLTPSHGECTRPGATGVKKDL